MSKISKDSKKKIIESTAAVITINSPGDMTPKGARAVAQWLRDQADMFQREHHRMGPKKYRARYIYEIKP